MTRAFALLFAAVMVLAGAGHAQAQELDMRDIMGGGPNFSGRRRLEPDPRAPPSAMPANYAPGTIVINTAERRLYLVLRQRPGAALRHRRRPRRLPLERTPTASPQRRNGRAGRRRRRCWRGGPICRAT